MFSLVNCKLTTKADTNLYENALLDGLQQPIHVAKRGRPRKRRTDNMEQGRARTNAGIVSKLVKNQRACVLLWGEVSS